MFEFLKLKKLFYDMSPKKLKQGNTSTWEMLNRKIITLPSFNFFLEHYPCKYYERKLKL